MGGPHLSSLCLGWEEANGGAIERFYPGLAAAELASELVGLADEHGLFCGGEVREGLRSWVVGGHETAVQAYTQLQGRDGGAVWPCSDGGQWVVVSEGR